MRNRINYIILIIALPILISSCGNNNYNSDIEQTTEKEESKTESDFDYKSDSESETEAEAMVNQYPQYLAVHKIDQPGLNQWYMDDPDTVNQASFEEVINIIGDTGTSERRLAISYTFEYTAFPIEKIKKSIENMLILSEKNDIPVILHLDGVNYVTYYPQLWNFWDSEAAGYNPENYKNVERWGWGEETAVKIGWRNWGSQIRVGPAPNLASPQFLQLQKDCLNKLLPVIADWYDNLPENRKYLLGGVVFGWELSTYVQSYFYENGNDYLNKPPSSDPTGGLIKSLPLGYAAAAELGIQSSGIITAETEDKICSFYMEYLIDLAIDMGIDPSRIITHSFYGGETENGGGQSGSASISRRLEEGVVPGWSFYGEDIYEMETVVEMADEKNWAAIEYKPWNLSYSLLNRTFNYKGCRYINIFNWNAIKNDEKTIDVLSYILKGK